MRYFSIDTVCMNAALVNPSKLSEYRNKLDIIKRTADQIIKDFEIYNEVISFSGKSESAYEELSAQIDPIVRNLMSCNTGRFLSLLYRIDVEEEKVNKAISQGNSAVSQITHLILERELLKVVTRDYFKKNYPNIVV
jgi:hypothetical protein